MTVGAFPRLTLPPFVRTSPTSREAAVSVYRPVTTLRRRVFEFLLDRGGHGATADELEVGLGLSGNTIRPRLVELRERGFVVDSGATRPTRAGRRAVVYLAEPAPVSEV